MSTINTIGNAVRRASEPSELQITDIRVATIRAQGLHPILKIGTNQGVYGLSEVCDGAHPDTAMRLKPLLIGQNPCNVEYLFRRIKRYGGESREAGGVCVQHQGPRDAGLRPERLLHQHRRKIRTLALMDFPAHDLAAEDIHDQIEVK